VITETGQPLPHSAFSRSVIRLDCEIFHGRIVVWFG
jgi:hypothetical protein